jgi:hypothetical protein
MSTRPLKKRQLTDVDPSVREYINAPPVMKLRTSAARNETMMQTVQFEFGGCIKISDALVMTWKNAGGVEKEGTQLALAWGDTALTLSVTDPGDSAQAYLRGCTTDDLGCVWDDRSVAHLTLKKKLQTAAEWLQQFWPVVSDMITIVFRHSLFCERVSGLGSHFEFSNVHHMEASHEVESMVVRIWVHETSSIEFTFYAKGFGSVVDIRWSGLGSDFGTLVSDLLKITGARSPHYLIRDDGCLRNRFQRPEDLEVLVSMTHILAEYVY